MRIGTALALMGHPVQMADDTRANAIPAEGLHIWNQAQTYPVMVKS